MSKKDSYSSMLASPRLSAQFIRSRDDGDVSQKALLLQTVSDVASGKTAGDELTGLGYYSSKDIARRSRQRLLQLAVLLLLWYSGAVVTITTSKELMNQIHMPFFLCLVQFLCASIFSALYLQYGGAIWNQISSGSASASAGSAFALPTALRRTVFAITTAYTFGFILTNSAFSMVTAAFAETVKSTEPFTTVAIGLVFFQERVSARTYMTLIPICCGVAFACYHDNAFHMWGFLLAFASNFCFSLRAVLAKRLAVFHGERLDEIQLFFHISSQGLIYLVPITLFAEGQQLRRLLFSAEPRVPFETGSLGSSLGLCGLFVLNGLLFAVYNLVSYLVLRRTDLVTHSVLNAFRRVFIIVFTTVYFQLSLSAFNALGVLIAVGGVIAFGISKARDNKI